MTNIKDNICKNLVLLRKTNKLTQQEFAAIFNYSDKAVSRWERGDSLPSIEMLSQICDYYGVEFEWLIKDNTVVPQVRKEQNTKNAWYRAAVMLLFSVSIFTIATVAFVYLQISRGLCLWQLFVWAVPVSCLGAFWYSKKWKYANCQFIFISLALWTVLASAYVSMLPYNTWTIFIVGIPLQLTLILLAIMARMKK